VAPYDEVVREYLLARVYSHDIRIYVKYRYGRERWAINRRRSRIEWSSTRGFAGGEGDETVDARPSIFYNTDI